MKLSIDRFDETIELCDYSVRLLDLGLGEKDVLLDYHINSLLAQHHQ